MNFDIKTLELFIRVAALGAIGKAGREFGLSSTAASQRIQALEELVGMSLFHRTTRSVSLSSDGQFFLNHALKIVATVEEAFSELQEQPSLISGEIKVACSSSFGRKQIAPYMAEFLENHPKVKLNLDLSDDVIDIVKGGYDLAIRLGRLPPSTLKARKIASSPRILVAAPSYLERYEAPQDLETLSKRNCLKRGDIKSWQLRTPQGEEVDVKISGNFASNHAEAVTEGALSGIGITRKCKWEVAEYLQNGQLIEILKAYRVTPEWDIFAVRPPSGEASARVKAFTSFLEKKYRKIEALQKL